MSLTKKHFEKIAEIIGGSKDIGEITEKFNTYFKEINPLFNEEKFMEEINIHKIKSVIEGKQKC